MAQANVIRSFLCILVLCLSLVPSASAWSNGGYSSDYESPDLGTHDWIADHALELQNRDVSFLSTTYHSRFLLGTEAPDNPDLVGDTLQHHVYYFSSGAIQEDNAADRAATIYESALTDLKSSNYSAAAYHIGIMCHYIADAGAFGHTMGASTDWGTEVHHGDYEDEMNSVVSSYDPDIDRTVDQDDAYNSTLALAREITFGNGSIRSNVWMDQNYDWTNADFVDSAKASLVSCVLATASAINSLMVAVNADPATPDDTTDDEPSRTLPYIIYGAVIAATTALIALVIRSITKK